MSVLLERKIQVPRAALDADERKPAGTGMILMLAASILFWAVVALIWL